jgi:uncharacterized protein YyaL (SSP411 family)
MATLVLMRLAALTGEGRYREAAERALEPMAATAAQHPTGFSQWLIALQLSATPIIEVAIVGEPAASDTLALVTAAQRAQRAYRPGQVMAVSPSPDRSAIPLLHGRTRIEGTATAYVCVGFACRRPVTDAAALTEQLATAAGSHSGR